MNSGPLFAENVNVVLKPRSAAMDLKEAYLERRLAELVECDEEIKTLEYKAANVKADMNVGLFEQLEALRARYRGVQQKLDELRESGDESWDSAQRELDSAWNDLQSDQNRVTVLFA